MSSGGPCHYCKRYQCVCRDTQTNLTTAEATIATLRERIAELERIYRHTHKAHYRDGELTRQCDTCGLDLTDPIHTRATPTPAAKETTDEPEAASQNGPVPEIHRFSD